MLNTATARPAGVVRTHFSAAHRALVASMLRAGTFPPHLAGVARRFAAETGRTIDDGTVGRIARAIPRSEYAPGPRDDRWSDDGRRAPMTDAQRSLASDPAALEMARRIAASYARRLPRSMADEIESAALYGLMRAAMNNDPDRPEPFGAFARRFIRGAVISALRRNPPMASLDHLGHDGESLAGSVPFALDASF